MDILNSLNPKQYQAVTLPDEHALVLAGAGSGKTKVLISRIAWLINQGLVSAYGILAVTFTNKAAKEMQERLSHMIDFNVKTMFIGTFHGLCHRLLRLHANLAGLSHDFQILDMQDQASFIKKLLKANEIDEDIFEPKILINFINQAKERGERSSQVDLSYDKFKGKLIELYSLYEQECQKQGVLDFAELLLRCDELLATNQELRNHYQQRFKYILIDEFQDTNALQYTWLKRFFSPQTNNTFFAVGDDDQSIYSFRGARVKNMHDFEQEFKVKHLVKLEQNYRSYAHILNCANAIIANNGLRLGKNLFTTQGEGEKVNLYHAQNDNLEALWIAQNIVKLIDNGSKAQDIAILYRSNAQSRAFEHTLFKHHIPYKVYGGLRFFERAEIKHALAYLHLIDNLGQNLAFLRVVNFPTRGIGNKTIEQLQEIATNLDINLVQAIIHLNGKAKINVEQFIDLIEKIKLHTQNLNLAQAIEYILQASGLINHYAEDKEGEERINNLKELISAAHNFYTEENIPHDYAYLQELDNKELELEHLPPNISPLRLFLSYASLESGENKQQGVQLMTIHASKGLEFNNVFLAGVEEGLFPNQNNANTLEAIEEERRLMYVAITRARKNLYITLSYSRMLYGKTSSNRPSRFIEELPIDNIKWLSANIHHSSNNDEYKQEEDIFSFDNQSSTTPFWIKNTAKKEYNAYTKQSQEIVQTNLLAKKIYKKSINNQVKTNDKIYTIGQLIFSTKFGEGEIKAIEGNGDSALAKIKFKKHGDKVLNLNVANLEII